MNKLVRAPSDRAWLWWSVLLSLLRALVAFRMESVEFAHTVDAPTLLLASTDDRTIPYASPARLAEAFSDCTLVAFEGFDHNEFWASPEVRSSLTDFLADVKLDT